MVSVPIKRLREIKSNSLDTTLTSMAKYLMILSSGPTSSESYDGGRVFECKTCNRQFSSFQALGGHRASHKKPRLDGDMTDDNHTMVSGKAAKAHKCSICGVEFAIGQALGGHMRRHRAAAAENHSAPMAVDLLPPVVKKVNSRRIFSLDLNLTPPENDFGFRVDDEKVTPITVDFFL